MAVPVAPPKVFVQKRSLFSRMGDRKGALVMAILIFVFGAWVFYPLALIALQSFNGAPIGQPTEWTLANWQLAFSDPRVFGALGNSVRVFVLYMAIGYPTAVLIAWILARTNIPFSRHLEFGFWISFMMPTISVTIGWTFLLGACRRKF